MAWKQGLGSTYQGYHANLNALAGVAAATDKLPYFSSSSAMSLITLGAFADDILAAASQSDARSILGLVIGTNVQAYDAQLADVAAVTPSANQFLGGDGSNLVMRTAAQVKTSLGYYTSGDSPTFGTVTLTAGTISTTPTSGTDIANKTYVDSIAAGLRDFKDSVRAATNASLPAYSRTGNVITASANGALAAVDGVTLVANDRLLLKNGAAGEDNGIYVVTTVGDGSNPYVLTRSTDADTSAEVTSGMYCWVSEGTANANSAWVLSTADPITLNTTSLSFTQFSGASQITAGDGLSKSGNTLSVNVDNSSIEISSDTLQVKAGGITSAMIADGAIVNADINASAAIAYSKLALSNSLTAGDYTAGSVGTAALADAGVTAAKLAAAVAGNGLAGGAGAALSVNVDNSSIEISSDTLQVKAGGITSSMLASGALGGSLAATLGATTATSLSVSGSTTMAGAVYETGVQAPITAAGTAIAATTRYVLFNGTSTYAQNLPAAVLGRVISFKKATTGTVTLTPASGEYLDGVVDGTIAMDTANSALTLVSMANGTWSIF